MARTKHIKIDVKPLVDLLGMEEVIRQMGGMEEVIRQLGAAKVGETLVKQGGLDDLLASLTPAQRKQLRKRLQEETETPRTARRPEPS